MRDEKVFIYSHLDRWQMGIVEMGPVFRRNEAFLEVYVVFDSI